jgi:3-deoxy-D-manno-octulosonic-acid transferase
MFTVYNVILTLLAFAALPLLSVALLLGKRYREGLSERLGFYPRPVREAFRGTRAIWIHAASVGEVLSCGRLALELKLRSPGCRILLSTATAAGARIAVKMVRAADGVIFFPLDHPWCVHRALSVFDPSVVIFLEAEVWPNFLRAAHRKGIPAILLSGRLSAGSFRRYARFRFFFSDVFGRWSAAGMQTAEDARRMVELGVEPQKVSVTGNLKHAPWTPEALGKSVLHSTGPDGAARRVLVAGSTHRGEEELLLDAFLALKPRFPTLQMVLAPRHPHRFPEVDRLLKKRGIRYLKQSRPNGRREEAPDVIFLDTLGDLPAFYPLAEVAFVGGSLVDAGGHNILEPARCGKPVVFGPYMRNFFDMAQEVKVKGGGIEVRSREELVQRLSDLLDDPERAARMGEAAFQALNGDRGVIRRSLELVGRYLQRR